GTRARPVLAAALGFSSRAQLGRSRLRSRYYVDHHLLVAQFRLELTLACERSSVFELVEWLPELELERDPFRVGDPKTKKSLVLIPDGAFVLRLRDGREQQFLVEVDMGTETFLKPFKAKLRGYLSLNPSYPILFITPSLRRQDAIAKWAAEEAQSLGTRAD